MSRGHFCRLFSRKKLLKSRNWCSHWLCFGFFILDLALDSYQKVLDVSESFSLKGETRKLVLAIVLSNVFVFFTARICGEMRTATEVGIGSIFVSVNMAFYGLLSLAIFVKKNIAWVGPVIVIKYLFLIVSVYFIWAYRDVLLVLVGMFAGLFTTITLLVIFKKFWRRDKKNGSL